MSFWFNDLCVYLWKVVNQPIVKILILSNNSHIGVVIVRVERIANKSKTDFSKQTKT